MEGEFCSEKGESCEYRRRPEVKVPQLRTSDHLASQGRLGGRRENFFNICSKPLLRLAAAGAAVPSTGPAAAAAAAVTISAASAAVVTAVTAAAATTTTSTAATNATVDAAAVSLREARLRR